ncbi:MAG TPA: response regulator, partial [Candidatus Sulfotelmatobacter sp.]
DFLLFCRDAYAGRIGGHPPRLVLRDLKLPKVDGLQVLKVLKNDSRTKAIPIVMMTSSREERDLHDNNQSGVNSFFQKPVSFDQFRETVKSLGLYWLGLNQPPVFNLAERTAGASH